MTRSMIDAADIITASYPRRVAAEGWTAPTAREAPT